ncbi:hypothetical protein, partial [Endozoicomonas atrinae]|uniref:hypothetical protein n=1 Tax=Endozoicomonas atrinae TaxID=1333660 RepID=UPI001EE730D4
MGVGLFDLFNQAEFSRMSLPRFIVHESWNNLIASHNSLMHDSRRHYDNKKYNGSDRNKDDVLLFL